MDEPSPPPGVPPGIEPRWTHDIRDQVVERVGPFFTTAREYVFHPVRFGKRWASGERFAMNPLWFAASAVAVMTTLQTVIEDLAGERARRTVVENAVHTLAPYAYYVSIGLGAHVLLRAFGSRRRLTSSIAMSLYAGGTMATLGQLVALAAFATLALMQGPGLNMETMPAYLGVPFEILLGLVFTGFYTVFGCSMGGLHGMSVARVFFANGAAMMVSALFCHFVPPPTMHVAVSIWQNGHFTWPEISASTGL